MIYLRQKPKGPPLPGTWVLNKDSPQAQGLLGWWVAGGSNLLVPDYSGRKVHAAGEAGTSAVVNDFGPAVRTQKTTTGAIDGGGFRLPTGITEYSALIDTVPVTLNSDNRYGAMGQVQTEGAPNNQYDWIGCYLGTTFTFNFFPIFGSSVASTSTAAAGRRIHWMGAYKSGVRTNQYINGKLDGTSASITGAMTSIADFAIGRGWTSGTLTFPMQFREARIYNRFITEDEAADWYGKSRWDLYYELGRRTIYLPATSAGETVVGAGGVSAVGAIGTVTATGGALAEPTGVQAEGLVGTVTVDISESVSVSGVSAEGKVGTVTATGDAAVEVSGVSANGLVGDVSVTAGTIVETSGVKAEGKVGSVTTAYDMAFAVSGVAADGKVGTVAIASANDAIVQATGVSADGLVGTVAVTADFEVPVSGVQAEGHVRSVTTTSDADVTVSGVAAEGRVGAVISGAGTVVSVSGVSAEGRVGTATITTDALATLAGVQAVGRVGNVGVAFDVVFDVTGVSAVGKVGAVTADIPPVGPFHTIKVAREARTIRVPRESRTIRLH